jgi:CheY-like chemotaxis protein
VLGVIVLRKKDVLIVDRSLELAQGCAVVLQERNYSVRIASSATEAVASLGDSRPELVILNLGMPDGESYRVMSLLHLTDGGSIPVLAIARPGAERARWGQTPVGMEFLSPSATVNELASAVERIIGPPLLTSGCRCALCDGVSRESALSFVHHRKGERASLDVPLCETCGNRLEKHLKRVIPKRLIELKTFSYGSNLAEPVGS